ncbi:MAG: hypothetical protein K0R17_1469 [Rariglobus sp.]|nr:hypothetical protein [Rariglobus sp.]
MKRYPFWTLLAAALATGFPSIAQAAVGDSQVARWKDNKTACFLLMFDDSCASHVQIAIPELVKRDMIGTFYINPSSSSYTSNANQWTNVIPQQGMVYGDHTWSHSNTTTLIGMEDEIRKCWEAINNIFHPGDTTPRLMSYGQPGVGTWFSYGQPLTDILNKYNLISRPAFIAAQAPFSGINTLPQLMAVADTAITAKGMGYAIFHGLQRRHSEGDPDLGFQDFWAFDKAVYRDFLDGLKLKRDSGDLWITDHISYHKYEAERNAATIAVTSTTSSLVTLTLTTTKGALYDLPLTLTTEVPVAWKAAVVVQDARTVNVPVINGKVLYDALPNAGSVSITESPLPVVTIKAISPEAYETGAAPGVFTVSTTGTQPLSINYTITGTAAIGTRHTLAAGPLPLTAPSTTVNVTPVPNTVYEGEQSVIMTITPGNHYVISPKTSAIVMIHDRTDIPPADWYLHANQASGQDWNLKTTWWSQPVGGVAFSAFNRGTVADRFHTNGFEVRTKNSSYPAEPDFYGNNIVLDGSTARLRLAYTTTSGMPTNRLPSLATSGGSILPLSGAMIQILAVGTFTSLGTTQISNGGNATYPTSGINLRVSRLTGTGDLVLTNAIGTAGTNGSTLLNISNAADYRGKLNLVAGTLSVPTNLTSSGQLIVGTGTAVTNDKVVKVARLTIGNTVLDAGTYTAAQLNGRGVVFSGTGTITTSLLPDGWSDLDIGAPALSGAATYAGTTWTVTGGGTQIGGTSDKFNFASARTSTSSPSILARVTSIQNTHGNAQAGVMLRDNSDPDAPFAALTVSPGGVISFRARSTTGGTASSVQAGTTVAPPIWLKLTTTSGTCTGYYSTNNISWIQVGSAALTFANTPMAGLAVCAGIDTVKNASTFTGVAMENVAPSLTACTVSASSSPAGAGTIGGSGIFNAGTSVTLTATPSSGYAFAAWSESGTSTGSPSAYTFTVNGSRSLVANFQPSSLAAFKSASFTSAELGNNAVSGNSADPDNDGYPNLMEYALAMNPKMPDPAVPQGELLDGCLSLTYKRSKTAADLTYVVEVSGDLQTWKSGAADISTPVVQSDDGYTQTVRVKDLIAPTAATRRFIRLRVVTP